MLGCATTQLSLEERAAFKSADPFGFILFTRNCEYKDQVRLLINDLRASVGNDDLPIAIDQEGGRVARLKAPNWVQYPAARSFGIMYERDPEWGIEAVKLYTRITAYELVKLGITINCAPVVDLFGLDQNSAIGDRAFSGSPSSVAALARAQVETYLANGILPVIKHFPGHGRMRVDPHVTLPTIDVPRADLEAQDFVPFELLKDVPLGMNSHAVFTALDPENSASLSFTVNSDIIRGKMGFDGLLLSDDLQMKALNGNLPDLALRASEAGNDVVLCCGGEIGDAIPVARNLNPMGDKSWARWQHAREMVTPMDKFYNPADDIARLDVLLGGLAYDPV